MKDKQTLLWLYKNSKTQLIPMLALILSNAAFSGCGILFALACRSVIDSAAAGGKSALLVQGMGLFVVIVLQLGLRILCRNLEVRIQGRLEMTLKVKLFGKILRKDYAHIMQYHSGELMNRLTGDITVTSEGLTTLLPNFIGLVTKMSLALAVLYIFDPLFALIFACGGLVLFMGVRFFRGKLKGLHKKVQEKDGVVRSFMQEMLENMLVVKTFGVETEMQEKVEGYGQEHYKAKLKKNTVSILANSGVSFAFSLGYLYALLWCVFGLAVKTISFGTLTAILQLAAQVQTPLSGLSGLIPMAYSVMASAERMMELENLSAQVSCAAEFISTLPDGLNTVIGEKGMGLSEGQVQRLAIARAILSGPPILLLDEATSALDEATEEKLINNIRSLSGKTCILISHKKTALSVCDKEIRIENGSLVTVERRRQRAGYTA